ncbi:YIP1 family protein [Actinomadura sp. ATCC 31491]|uniref:YIP1 family protein n=1 Tax=Actinomadura luzonensis TaxID=2805427 RepID=A0ABT0FJG3_9ACTN|nr:Yip1 family protein [Actinomadura luzonensis]MCK2212437.1 YIP1 family protein [Actinomadura luzonensis]
MNRVVRSCAGLFIRPRAALTSVLGEPHRIGFGLLGPVALAVVYFAGISAALAMGVMHAPQSPALRISDADYYAYERFYILPVGIAGTVMAAGVTRLLAGLWHGRGRFEDLFALLGFALVAVAVAMGLPDLVLAVLAGLGVPGLLGWMLSGPHIWLGTLWYAVLTVLAVKEVERLSWGKTIALAAAGLVANGLVQFVFIR